MFRKPRPAGPLADEGGQVIVEFILVFAMLFTMIFLFVLMSWGIAFGHFAHYSTFMAARAYLSGGITQADQVDAAGGVLGETVKANGQDLFPFMAKSRNGTDRDATGSEPVPGAMVGTNPYAVGKETSPAFIPGRRECSSTSTSRCISSPSAFSSPIAARGNRSRQARLPSRRKPCSGRG